MRSLVGKVALVTGGSSPIGQAIAVELARRGANVGLHYFRNRRGVETAAAGVADFGAKSACVKAHFGKPAEIKSLVDEVSDSLGGLDILVCNAASGVFRQAMDIDQEAWEWSMNISARAVLLSIQHAVPHMESRGGGRIVNISSEGSRAYLSRYAMVGAAKGAVDTLTRYLAVELAPLGIAVNAVSPGAVVAEHDEKHWNQLPDKAQVLQRIQERIPSKCFTTPDNVAKVVGFLSSPESQGIVGQTLTVDGGFSLS